MKICVPVLSLTLLAFTAIGGCASTSAPNPSTVAYKPAIDTKGWRTDVAAPRTQMAVLGSAHTAQLPGFDIATLNLLLDRLAVFNPTIITQEGVSGEQCETLLSNQTIYPGTADYCPDRVDTKNAQTSVGMTFGGARAEVEKVLADWPQTPTAAQRRRLAALFMASGDEPSAVVQWLQIIPAQRMIGDGVDDKVLAKINEVAARRSERIAIGAVLAARLGLERMHAVDDQTALSVWGKAGPGMDAGMNLHWQEVRKLSSPVLDEHKRLTTNLKTSEDTLSYFRFLNTPAVQVEFVETDFRAALRMPGPNFYGQQYYAFNDLRNWRMVASILEVSSNSPGARVLNIVGASHKPYYEAYLDNVPYVQLVDMKDILK